MIHIRHGMYKCVLHTHTPLPRLPHLGFALDYSPATGKHKYYPSGDKTRKSRTPQGRRLISSLQQTQPNSRSHEPTPVGFSG
jgi:hypothetical protein